MDTYNEFVRNLEDREYFGQRLGLERIQSVLDQLENPERQFPSIHIVGTNGKGSTAVMSASILRESGYRVGLYTSPHLVDFCERIRILDLSLSTLPLLNKEREKEGEVTRDQLLHYAHLIHEVEEEPLTFFELATAIAFLHFEKEKVDIAVIEVGLGGRLDATNVITPLVSVITSIGLDHTQHLGDTIEKIAFEKAGIIKPGVPVVVGELPEEAMGVVRKAISDLSPRPPLLIKERGSEGVRSWPIHQLQNAAVAATVVQQLQKQGWSIPDEAIRAGLAKTQLPGRLETIQEEPWILLDGAHNPQAMATARQFLESRLEGRRLKVLFGAMADKDLKEILSVLAPITDEILFTAPDLKRAADPELLLQIGNSLGIKSRAIKGVGTAFESTRGALQKNEVLLVTGSFYVVGEIKKKRILDN